MSFSLSSWISTLEADAKKAESGVLSVISHLVPALDNIANAALPILQVVDPAAVPAVTAGKAVIDEVYAVVQNLQSVPPEGVTVTISPETASAILKAGTDAKSWLSSVGVKL